MFKDYVGPYVAMRNLAARCREAGKIMDAEHYEAVRDLVARMKGETRIKEELDREEKMMKCLRCEAEPECEITDRHDFAHEFATWIEDSGLSPGKETLMEMTKNSKGSPYYRIGWADVDGEIGGEVQIFSDAWVHVKWDGGVDGVPARGHQVFESDFAAQAFIEAIVARDWAQAVKIPAKSPS